MFYTSYYSSPLGRILIASTDDALVGLWFEGQKNYGLVLGDGVEDKETEVIKEAKKWLDIYFAGEVPSFTPKLEFIGTEFQKEVWNLLLHILYGKTEKYGTFAVNLAQKCGISKMSARAVGAAIGRNNISIIVPCHRVVGSDGRLVGYAGGLDKKQWLIAHELR